MHDLSRLTVLALGRARINLTFAGLVYREHCGNTRERKTARTIGPARAFVPVRDAPANAEATASRVAGHITHVEQAFGAVTTTCRSGIVAGLGSPGQRSAA